MKKNEILNDRELLDVKGGFSLDNLSGHERELFDQLKAKGYTNDELESMAKNKLGLFASLRIVTSGKVNDKDRAKLVSMAKELLSK